MHATTIEMVLTGRLTLQTCVLNKHTFVNGRAHVTVQPEAIAAFLTYMARSYQCYPAGSQDLADKQAKDRANGILDHIQAHTAAADGAPAAVHSDEHRPTGTVSAEGALQSGGDVGGEAGSPGLVPGGPGHSDAGLREGVDAGQDGESSLMILGIRREVSKLDYTVDEQWNPEGLPSVDYVANAVGDQKVSRQLIDAACPGFNRHKAEDLAAI